MMDAARIVLVALWSKSVRVYTVAVKWRTRHTVPEMWHCCIRRS